MSIRTVNIRRPQDETLNLPMLSECEVALEELPHRRAETPCEARADLPAVGYTADAAEEGKFETQAFMQKLMIKSFDDALSADGEGILTLALFGDSILIGYIGSTPSPPHTATAWQKRG